MYMHNLDSLEDSGIAEGLSKIMKLYDYRG